MTRVEQELEALQVATRTNEALSLVDFFEDDSDMYIVSRKPKQTLLEYFLKQNGEDNLWLEEAATATLLAPIVDTLVKLHRLGVVHGDLSLSKIAIRVSKNDRVNIQVHGFDQAHCIKPIKGQTSSVKVFNGSNAPECMSDDVYTLG